ncbi:MAG: DnaJ domain-containing protein [Nitrospinae bacterium]|nr:DnaJ domain-containing protein [Nitrospinota bacterium]
MLDKKLKNYYLILGLNPGATTAQVKRAYKNLAFELHPDRAGEGGAEAFLLAREAYETLKDKKSRAVYDRLLLDTGYGAATIPGQQRPKGQAVHNMAFVTSYLKRKDIYSHKLSPFPPPKITAPSRQCLVCHGRGVVRDMYEMIKTCKTCEGTGRRNSAR